MQAQWAFHFSFQRQLEYVLYCAYTEGITLSWSCLRIQHSFGVLEFIIHVMPAREKGKRQADEIDAGLTVPTFPEVIR